MEPSLRAIVTSAALVGSGGFLGALARYGLSGLVHRNLPFSPLPYGTLGVNLVGCLVIGGVMGLVDSRQLLGPELRTFTLIGLLGGFTTFSTFGYETFVMIRDGEIVHAMANVGAHVVLGVVLVWLGYSVLAR